MKKVEQLTQSEFEDSVSVDSSGVTVSSLNQLSHSPSSVLMKGLDSIKLIPIYKLRKKADRSINHDFSSTYTSREYEPKMNYRYFMPGIDVLRGYNLVNVAHYQHGRTQLSV